MDCSFVDIILFGALDKSTPTANAAGRERRVDTTDDVGQKKQRRNEIRRTAYIGGGGGFLSGAGTITKRRRRTKDQVQQNRRNRSDGSCETSLTDSGGGGGGGGGGVMSTGREEVGKLSAGRPLLAEAVEFSPAPAREQHRRDHAHRNQRNQPDASCRAPLIQSRGGGVRFTAMAEVHRPPSTDDEGEILAQPAGNKLLETHIPGEPP